MRELCHGWLEGAQSDAERAAARPRRRGCAGGRGDQRIPLRGQPHSIRLIEERDPRAAQSLGRMREHSNTSRPRPCLQEPRPGDCRGRPHQRSAVSCSCRECRDRRAGNFGAAEEALAGAILRASETVADPLTVARMFWSQSRLHSHRQGTQTDAAATPVLLRKLLEASDETTHIARAAIQRPAHIDFERRNNAEPRPPARPRGAHDCRQRV